jgi:hypothetical protein
MPIRSAPTRPPAQPGGLHRALGLPSDLKIPDRLVQIARNSPHPHMRAMAAKHSQKPRKARG